MRATSIFALAAGVLSLGAESIKLVERDRPAVVQFGIERREVGSPVERDRLRRRDSSQTIQQVLDNELTLYFANVTMGTPPQNLRLHIDTGSSDLWTNSASSRLCRSKDNLCVDSGTYDANSSSTYQYVSSDFNISYVDGSAAIGDYATDILRIGGAELKNLQFGIGYLSSSTEGILGIGYPSNEVQVNRNQKQSYSNLPQLMVDQKFIQSNAFSLWLDDLESSTGLVLFGGVNTEKYHGSLSSLPIARYQGQSSPSEFIIAMTGLDFTDANGGKRSIVSDTTIPVLLDSGSSLSYLPNNIVSALFRMFNAKYDAESQAAYVPCSLANTGGTLDFTFTQPTISVPMNELVIDPGVQSDGRRLTFGDGTPACLFGISSSGGSTNVLGDTFLRSAYVVYDLDNNQISLAQTNFNSTQDNIKEIGTGPSAVPDATGVPGAGIPVATATGGGRLGSPTQTGTIPGDIKSSASTLQVPLVMVSLAICLFTI
ncbi:hypothetical protein FGG08_004699 [Glutinoglossum americanum]|uniref:Probable aspartic-type endopeptidase OPSB n=1 Tax=Glutinoglossum americanum TaxID=1670608 RepID=A0A9P8I565_9PEZI|nr:hypothetical protein FGG08_004699 [Glutinoglossum americanum]